MKIGIYTAYDASTVLGKEGLGRYLGSLVRGFTASGHEVTVACPQWSEETVRALLLDFQIDPERVHLLISDKIPVVARLYLLRRKKKRREGRGRLRLLLRACWKQCKAVGKKILTITNPLVFALVALLAGGAGLVTGVVAIPLALVIGLLLFLCKKLGELLRRRLGAKADKVRRALSKKRRDAHIKITTLLTESVCRHLVDLINASEAQDVWFVPALFWPEIHNIQGTRVVCAPDLVTALFPGQFAQDPYHIPATRRCVRTLEQETYFVTYCDYLRDSLLRRKYKKEETITIPHANNDMASYITIDAKEEVRLNAQKSFTTAFARGVLEGLRGKAVLTNGAYFSTLSMKHLRYVFYASQCRPHKNMLSLVRAYEELLRRRYCGVKLLLTADLGRPENKEIADYILAHRLQYDILCCPNLTVQELAAAYHCAELVVNPTLYEGGFPFTFGEGMSVGAPSVMSDIPQTREVVEAFGLADEMLFDPYDWRAMAERIEYGLENRAALYEQQLPLYRAMAERTAQVVAGEYVAAFEYFIEKDRANG